MNMILMIPGMMPAGYAALLLPVGLTVLAIRRSSFIRHTLVTASAGLILMLGGGLPFISTGWPLLAGLLASIIGDFFLHYRKGRQTWYGLGIACFFLAHLLFLLFCLMHSSLGWLTWISMAVLLAGYLAFYRLRLVPAVNAVPLRVLMLLYILISSACFSASLGLTGALLLRLAMPLAVGLILFSDTLIACKDFLGQPRGAGLIIPTYLAAHCLMTLAGLAMM
jgi:uncharacterized membrane protein YhhN